MSDEEYARERLGIFPDEVSKEIEPLDVPHRTQETVHAPHEIEYNDELWVGARFVG